ncbi:MAG TPA: hypothetical protein VF151_10110 [Gemmatimonadales bacterium]
MLTLPLLLAACAPIGCAKPDPCAVMRAIYVSPDDVLTDGTAKQILAHDQRWAALCKAR